MAHGFHFMISLETQCEVEKKDFGYRRTWVIIPGSTAFKLYNLELVLYLSFLTSKMGIVAVSLKLLLGSKRNICENALA